MPFLPAKTYLDSDTRVRAILHLKAEFGEETFPIEISATTMLVFVPTSVYTFMFVKFNVHTHELSAVNHHWFPSRRVALQQFHQSYRNCLIANAIAPSKQRRALALAG